MNFGLSNEIIEEIKNIVIKYKQYKFEIFGSRARGDYHKKSDIDIAIWKDVSEDDKYKIMNDFDMLNIIYKIDLVFITDDTKKELLNSIKLEGKKL